MKQAIGSNIFHCNQCGYEGPAKTNSTQSFVIFMILLCTSVFFLPLIIVALIYMGFIVAKPAKKACYECKSNDLTEIPLDLEINAKETVETKSTATEPEIAETRVANKASPESLSDVEKGK